MTDARDILSAARKLKTVMMKRNIKRARAKCPFCAEGFLHGVLAGPKQHLHMRCDKCDVYETFVGEIPFGYDVDHICAKWAPDPRVCRKCVNPDHLQAIPPLLNQQLKVLRRLGYDTYDMPFDNEPSIERPPPAPVRPLLAPGETEEDVWL